MMKKLARTVSRFSRFFDPFLVFGIFVLFAVPVITLLNLTPTYNSPQTHTENVLGTTDQNNVSVTTNPEAQAGISVEKMTQTGDNSYTIYVQTDPHQAGAYGNRLFTATNSTHEEKTLVVTSTFENISPDTKVSLLVDSVKFIVRDTDGTTYPPAIYLKPNSSVNVFVEIENASPVNFISGFSLDVTVE